MQAQDEKIIQHLNKVLTHELTAVNQFFVHAKMCTNWGFEQLGSKRREQAFDEMRHTEKLIDRILFLEGLPNLQDLNKINVGTSVEEQLRLDLQLENSGLPDYREALAYCRDHRDDVSKELMEQLIKDEEEDIDWLEAQVHRIQLVGVENYLSQFL